MKINVEYHGTTETLTVVNNHIFTKEALKFLRKGKL